MNGWLRLHRQLLQWEWYSCANTTRVFIHLLLTASWRNARWQGVEIPRGSVFASPDTLAAATGLSRQQVRTVLTRLKSTSEITTKSTSKGTLITLCNFETYNSEETQSNQHFNQHDNQKLTSDQPAINQRLTTSEEGKKVKKERKKRVSTLSEDELLAFEDFWRAYPKRKEKPVAEEAWAEMKPDLSACLSTLQWQCDLREWKEDGGKWIPHPAKWIRNRRWTDEPTTITRTDTELAF